MDLGHFLQVGAPVARALQRGDDGAPGKTLAKLGDGELKFSRDTPAHAQPVVGLGDVLHLAVGADVEVALWGDKVRRQAGERRLGGQRFK